LHSVRRQATPVYIERPVVVRDSARQLARGATRDGPRRASTHSSAERQASSPSQRPATAQKESEREKGEK
jgi:hypothetical protein